MKYIQTSNISRILVGNKIVDHSDVIGASPVGIAPSTSSFSTDHLASMVWVKTIARWDKKYLSFVIWCTLYKRFDSNSEEYAGVGKTDWHQSQQSFPHHLIPLTKYYGSLMLSLLLD